MSDVAAAAVAFFLAGLCVLQAAQHPRLSKAKWIWDGADTGDPDEYTCLLGKTVTLKGRPISARALVTADNHYEFLVNGTSVGSDLQDPEAHWQKVKQHDFVKLLKPGKNSLAVRGKDVGGIGGLAAAFRIEMKRDGKAEVLELATDKSWRVLSPSADAGIAAQPRAVAVLGPMGMAPWGWIAEGLPPRGRAHLAPQEPETRTLTPAEAQSLLEDEWLFQAEGQPLQDRTRQEIQWARELAQRLSQTRRPPGLAAELVKLDDLQRTVDAPGNLSPVEARKLYLDVRRLKRQIFLKDPAIDFSKLVFIDAPLRYPHESMHRVYPQAQLNCVRLLVLDGLHPGGKVRKLTDQVGPGWYWRPDVSFDAKRVLFCFRPEKDRTFHLYEAGVDGRGLRQITSGKYDDLDPIYMPDGRFAFVTNRGGSHARCVVGHPSTVLARCDADGKNIYFISAGNEPEYTPALMPNGQILYTRWEYTDRELMRIQSLWITNPDGTGTSVYWGNQSYWPDMLIEARAIPDDHRIIFSGQGHHNVYNGSIGIVDQRLGYNYPDGLTKVTWDVPWCEVGNGPAERPECAEYHSSGRYSGFKSPYPLSKTLFLVSARRARGKGYRSGGDFKLFFMDIYGNRELVYQGAFSCQYAMPIKPRPVPPVIPDRTKWAGTQKDAGPVAPATFYCTDVYQGVPEVLRGKAKYLRVLQLDYNTMTLGKKIQDTTYHRARPHMHVGPVVSITVNDGVKRIHGEVPIRKDGSCYFHAPRCVPLHFQLLDENHLCLQTMRSFTQVMPGESRGCVGCHATHSTSPANRPSSAVRAGPDQIKPYHWGPDYSISYEHDIQPILDRHCGKCHQGNGPGRKKLDLTLRPSKDAGVFPEPYVTLTLGRKRDLRGHFPRHVEGGIAGTLLPEAQPWRPEHYDTLKPMTILSRTSELIDIARSGKHNKVRITGNDLMLLILWVDTLCPYRGERDLRRMADPDPKHPLFSKSNYPPSDVTVTDVYAESPYRPRMRTAPVINRAYRQDEFPDTESRLPRNATGEILPPIAFDAAGRRIVHSWAGKPAPNPYKR